MSTNELCKVNQDKKQSLRTQDMLKKQSARLVPPFSIQSLQKNTKVIPYSYFNRNRKLEKQPRCTSFRIHYERGDLPLRFEYFPGGVRINWTIDLNKLNYHLYLPLFFDGLSEPDHPYKTYARQGVRDLINFGRDKIYPVIPQLIVPIKRMCFVWLAKRPQNHLYTKLGSFILQPFSFSFSRTKFLLHGLVETRIQQEH